ncbi:MAG: hypothetical protein IJQ96_08565 [Bacteroidales bacterium]|nr:hypothetical protein [Bacteroidales bacterium]
MKSKIILSFTALLLVACVRESVQPEENGPKTFDCFTVSMEDSPMTKVHMEDGGAVKWDVGDCIGVYSDTQAPVPYYRGDDGKFYGEKVSGTKFYAFYPFESFVYDEEDPTNLKVSNPISGWLKGIALNIRLPMVATASDNALLFKQVSGLLHLIVKSPEPFSSCSFGAKIFDPYAGPVDLSALVPSISSTPRAWYTYCEYLVKSEELSLSDFELFLCLPPMTIEGGFTVTLQNIETGKAISKSTSKDVLIERGKMITYTFDVEKQEIAVKELLDLEREALVAFYQAMDGDNWRNNTNWCTDRPLGEWYGVTTNAEGLVTELSLKDNGLNGQIPEEIGDITSLKSLNLSTYEPNSSYTAYGGNNIYGPLPESIGKLTELSGLYLQNEMISGTLPESMKNMIKLGQLTISGRTYFDGTPMDYTPLSGPIPEWLGSLKNLGSLNLSRNAFSGPIPASLGNLCNLSELYLDYNQLTGPLPDIHGMSNLSTLGLSGNFFTGSIPAHYSHTLDDKEPENGLPWNTYRTEIYIDDNQLSGTLPEELISHKNFPERVWRFLYPQKKGYKIEIDNIPASRYIYEDLNGGDLDLGAEYSNSDYTMIVRWAEWCNPSRGFIPQAISLYEKYKDKGLQVIWAYAGGEENAREAYMSEIGLDQFPLHLIECYNSSYVLWGYGSKDHLLWNNDFVGYWTPFVEIVNREGNIIFVEDPQGTFAQYPVSYSMSKLDIFLSNLLGGDEADYKSTDFSADGTVHQLRAASKGAGINIVMMGDAYSDRLIADGTYEAVMRKAMDAFFDEEPYKSHIDYYNVYYIDVVSKNEAYYGITAFNTFYGDGSYVGGDDNKVFEYAQKILSKDQIDDALIIVMMNRDYYGGTCYMYSVPDGDYGRGPSIAYFPTSSDISTFNGVVTHEAGGHGFAKLADEYDYPVVISEDEVADRRSMEPFGWWKNIDFTSDPSQVKWAKFITDDRYASEGIGVYEGACTYQYGAWRPTEQSIMRHNIGGFNAPSREAIYYRIHKLAYGADWQYNYEDFVAWDLAHRTPAATSARGARPNFVEREFEPLAPPVVVNKDWREVVKK